MSLRIGIDLTVCENAEWTGVERYADRLAACLHKLSAPDLEFFFFARSAFVASFDLDDVVSVGAMPRALARRLVMPRVARRLDLDVLHSPVSHAPSIRGVACLRTLHDLGDGGALPRGSAPAICVSETTRAAARSAGFIPPTFVVHHGVDEEWFDLDRSVDSNAALCVGTVRERRHPDVVARAASRVRRDHPSFAIDWCGRRDLPVSADGGVRFLGFVDDAGVRELASRTSMAIVPASPEGFGLPILEALAARIPVIAADSPEHREAAGDCARYYAPRDADALAEAIAEVLQGVPEERLDAGVRRAAGFTWSRCAEEHVAIYRELAAKPFNRD